MLKLHGRPRSNYYNAVKAVLLEKGVPFQEVLEPVPVTPGFLRLSPMAKIPCLVTPRGPITETTVILDYLEESEDIVPMCPSDPFARAKQREICKSLELYVELVARRGYGLLRGESVAQHDKDAVELGLKRAIEALPPLLQFDPWIAGREMTYADFFGYFMFVYARLSAKQNAGIDLLEAIPGAIEWYARVEARDSMQKVLADATEYAKSLANNG